METNCNVIFVLMMKYWKEKTKADKDEEDKQTISSMEGNKHYHSISCLPWGIGLARAQRQSSGGSRSEVIGRWADRCLASHQSNPHCHKLLGSLYLIYAEFHLPSEMKKDLVNQDFKCNDKQLNYKSHLIHHILRNITNNGWSSIPYLHFAKVYHSY